MTALGSFSDAIPIGDSVISPHSPTYVIAEIGSNHDQSLDEAKELIHAAADAGADAVKFQSLKFDELYVQSRTTKQFRDFFATIELAESWYPELAASARRYGIHWFSSVTYPDAVALLVDCGASAMKIASAQFDIYPEVIVEAAQTGLPLIMSAGLADLGGVERMLRLVSEENNTSVVLLHCVSEYPTAPASVNLRMIQSYRQLFGCQVGWSDHTLGIETAIAAVALGAVVVEKHLTLDRHAEGPDHHYATEPGEFSAMVDAIRVVEASLGDGRPKALSTVAMETRKAVEMKIVTNRRIAVGQRITKGDVRLRRVDGDGLERSHLNSVIGALAVAELEPDEPLSMDSLSIGGDDDAQ